jgi:uncharacterized membrane protein YdbT with pleckstrin-like domain
MTLSSVQSPSKSGTDEEELLFEGGPALVPSFGVLVLCILTGGLWLFPQWWKSLSRRYRVTSRRIVVETGVLSKRLEQIDLYRVNDYTVERPFSQRLLGTGNLVLRTFDKNTPELRIEHVKTDVVALYERVRAATEADKARRGVRLVDYEGGGPAT